MTGITRMRGMTRLQGGGGVAPKFKDIFSRIAIRDLSP